MGCSVAVAELVREPALPRLELRPVPFARVGWVDVGLGQRRRRKG